MTHSTQTTSAAIVVPEADEPAAPPSASKEVPPPGGLELRLTFAIHEPLSPEDLSQLIGIFDAAAGSVAVEAADALGLTELRQSLVALPPCGSGGGLVISRAAVLDGLKMLNRAAAGARS